MKIKFIFRPLLEIYLLYELNTRTLPIYSILVRQALNIEFINETWEIGNNLILKMISKSIPHR